MLKIPTYLSLLKASLNAPPIKPAGKATSPRPTYTTTEANSFPPRNDFFWFTEDITISMLLSVGKSSIISFERASKSNSVMNN
jgi:hypothetical protein